MRFVLLSVLTVVVFGLIPGKAKAGHSSEVASLLLEVAALQQLLHEEVHLMKQFDGGLVVMQILFWSIRGSTKLSGTWRGLLELRYEHYWCPSAEATSFEVSRSIRYPHLSTILIQL